MCVFVHARECACVYVGSSVYAPGLFSSICWEQGFDKARESSRTLELFEGFDVQFWETGPWAPPPTFKSSQSIAYVYKFRGEKGARMRPCHRCRVEKGEP